MSKPNMSNPNNSKPFMSNPNTSKPAISYPTVITQNLIQYVES